MSKLNIATPTPTDFNLKLFGLQNIAPLKPNNAVPTAYPAPRDIEYNPLTVDSGYLYGLGSIAEQIIKGYLGKAFMSDTPDPVQKNLNVPIISSQISTPTVPGAALNGSPLYSNLEVNELQWTDFSGQTKGFPGMAFNTVLMTVSQQKNIVETSIQGSDDGSVFEYSGMNNYEVNINIIITGNNINGEYPSGVTGGVEDVLKMLECPYPIKVSSWYLQMFNIQELVILDYEMGQEPGGISQQPITIKCKSNKNTVLIIQDTNPSATS